MPGRAPALPALGCCRVPAQGLPASWPHPPGAGPTPVPVAPPTQAPRGAARTLGNPRSAGRAKGRLGVTTKGLRRLARGLGGLADVLWLQSAEADVSCEGPCGWV